MLVAMKVTLSWLKEYLKTEATLAEICQKLTAIGLEVEEVIDHSENLQPFNCVYVLEVVPHPDADKLHICTVDTGKETLQIVCGAPNVHKDMKAILAPIGSVIPSSGLTIKKSKLRGIDSCGMLCSGKELGIDTGKDNVSGIIEVDMAVPLGTNVAEIFGLKDPLIDINVTPNRGDCLGIFGIARDLAAAGLGELSDQIYEMNDAIEDPASDCHWPSPITVEVHTKNCALFDGRYIHNIHNVASPVWLQQRLNSVGINSISAVVDITNYVMYVTGKPLHAYDADAIVGGCIMARDAKDKEKFVGLNGNTYLLDKEAVVLADKKKILCLGGIFGSENSGTSLETTNVFLESAIFEPNIIARTGRKLNLETEARYRFERGVDLIMNTIALNMACKLIQEICGGQISERVQDDNIAESRYYSLERRVINYNQAAVNKILGTHISLQEGLTTLMRLSFDLVEGKHVKVINKDGVSQTIINTQGLDEEEMDEEAANATEMGLEASIQLIADGTEASAAHSSGCCCHHHESTGGCCKHHQTATQEHRDTTAKTQQCSCCQAAASHTAEDINFQVLVPYHRNDVSILEDLAEEIIRMHGLANLENQPMPVVPIDMAAKRQCERRYGLERLLAARGLVETCSFSFIEQSKAALFNQPQPELQLLNPISVELNYMRGSILPSLLEAYAKNKARGLKDLGLFELSRVFHGVTADAQPMHLSGIRAGLSAAKNLYHDEREVDFFDVKADVEAVLLALELDPSKLALASCPLNYYHPTRSAVWSMGNKPIAYFGELHPATLKQLNITQRICAFEIILENLPERKYKGSTKEVPEISDFQETRRDFAFLVPVEFPVGKIQQYICRSLKEPLIKHYHLFDVFQSKDDPVHKSIAFTVSLQAADHTLSGAEIEAISHKIIQGIEREFQAKLRDQ